MTDEQKIMSLLEVLKKYAESPHCYDREGDDYTPATYYEAFHNGSDYGEITFARTLLEQIGVEFKYP